ncbi:proline dioxygenase [Paraburkholderia phytofirmans OLGA172]|uniref:Proline dioxygenase n=1 Tax=Paraburkholderia phytofirmans OLGA172 TaxID=1417228 RepID=A0A160FST6_9BURK|nr:2OG-Fe(II) oxygenase [Paraburkholderia phytofirmans]ANB76001.1 proline dioxygenase [Paraburkholderia phytofirmans OLGA172]
MPVVNDAVKTWLNSHVERGFSPAVLVDAMVGAGFESELARATVNASFEATGAARVAPVAVAAAARCGVEAATGEYRYDPAPVAAGNLIRAYDRDVKVLMRCERPQIVAFADVMSDEECDEMIERSRPLLKRSTTVNPENGSNDVIPNRTSEGAWYHRGADPFLERLEQRFASLMNWPVENGEGLQVLRYGVGAEYRSHFDYFPPAQTGSAVHMARGGQRVATLVLYLNDVAAGGETFFPDAGVSIAPRRGGAVYFRYMNGARQLDPLSLHGGAPVLAGEKWIMTKWVREGVFA